MAMTYVGLSNIIDIIHDFHGKYALDSYYGDKKSAVGSLCMVSMDGFDD